MTNTNELSEPSFEQALAKLALFIEQGFSQQNHKLDILIDQVGHFTEGLTELKVLVQEQSETAKQQAAIAKQQADTVRSLADSVASLLAAANQKS